MSLEQQISARALELGIEKCGIIKPEAMLDYADRLQERMQRIPNGEQQYSRFMGFADIKRQFPWAKSIVVAVLPYGHYTIPKNAIARYGKSYLTDMRFNLDAPEHRKAELLGAYLNELGLKTASNEHPGITAMRWAAYKAGLGIIRRNNFFYTESGSWVTIAAWVTDGDMQLIGSHNLKECPPHCTECRKACKTKSLHAPYTMNMATCVSRYTTSNDPVSYDDEINRQIGE
ncbi:hypothetical protein LQZ18_12460 [Lachnospiraceae bacterium ZAX-1]